MNEHGFSLFDTAIGRCGVAWGASGITSVLLPDTREAATRARVVERFPSAKEATPPRQVKSAIDAMTALLRGEPKDLSAIELDMQHVPPFHQKVYQVARKIPRGATLSYGDIATRLGKPGSARAVGQALGKNPFAIVVPCHRVLAAGGKVGGFSATGGTSTKLKMLAIEGAELTRQKALFQGDGELGFDPKAALRHLQTSDPVLFRVIVGVGPFEMKLKRVSSLFGALSESIVYQQLTGKAAATIYSRVCALFPNTRTGLTPEHILGASEEALRGAGLSRSKMLSLKDLAAHAKAGKIPTLVQASRMDNEAIIEKLTDVRGIGRWTVEMLLMFRLGRPDVLPLDDYGIKKGFAVAFKKKDLPTAKDLAKRGELWKPHRTVASWYLWRAAEGAKPRKRKSSERKT